MFFFNRQQRHFWNTVEHLWWAFLKKKLTAKSRSLFLQKSTTIDFWLGSKYGSWQYCKKKKSHLKDIFPVALNFLCLYSYHEYFILWHNSAKRVKERIKDWTFEVYLITGEDSSWFLLIESVKITCARSYTWFLNFLSNGEGLDCFSQPNLLHKFSKITITCPKSVKMNE